jgi:tRNA threonylcarbamoyladenosine biosynthesis protein TsaE
MTPEPPTTKREAAAPRRGTCRFLARSEQDTRRLGVALAECLPAGTTVALVGTLGAGKTRLVQALAVALGVPPNTVVSPTFVLCQPYAGRRRLYHLDAYRLRDDDEFLQLGPEEYFESDGITLVEWADRVRACLPPEYVEIHIAVTGSEARAFSVEAIGARYVSVVEDLARRLGEGDG